MEGRALLRAGDRPGDDSLRQLALSYQSGLLGQPLAEVLRERDEGHSQLRATGTPCLTLHSCPLDPADTAWLQARLPQAEIAVWAVGHHFPHLAHPARFAALLTGLAAGRASRPPSSPLALEHEPGNRSRLQTSSHHEQISDNTKRKERHDIH